MEIATRLTISETMSDFNAAQPRRPVVIGETIAGLLSARVLWPADSPDRQVVRSNMDDDLNTGEPTNLSR